YLSWATLAGLGAVLVAMAVLPDQPPPLLATLGAVAVVLVAFELRPRLVRTPVSSRPLYTRADGGEEAQEELPGGVVGPRTLGWVRGRRRVCGPGGSGAGRDGVCGGGGGAAGGAPGGRRGHRTPWGGRGLGAWGGAGGGRGGGVGGGGGGRGGAGWGRGRRAGRCTGGRRRCARRWSGRG